MRVILAVFLSLVGCGDDGTPPPMDAGTDAGEMDAAQPPVDSGEPACTDWIWAPGSGVLSRWPEPDLLIDDPETATGVRIRMTEEEWGPTLASASGFRPVFTEDLSDLDGFGVNSQVYFRFGRAFDPGMLPSGEETAEPNAGLGIVVLQPGEPRIQPVLVTTTDEDATLLLAPMQPLPARGRAVAFVTRALTAAARGCLQPAPALAGLLTDPDPDTADAVAALMDLGVITAPGDLIAISAFPTQSIEDDSVAIAADIAGRSYALQASPTCTDLPAFRRCEAAFIAHDYRDDNGEVRRVPTDPVAPSGTYRVPVTIWLPPATFKPPYATILYGHGLGGGRDQAERLADFAAPEGIATVAIDAVQHGQHPTVPPGADTGTIATVLRFFTIGDLAVRAIRALAVRDHFRQSTWDKLQVTRVLEAGVDVDGDEIPDLDPGRLAYLGVSLGGIMGPELLALTDAYGAGVLVVPGGRVSSIISESPTFGPVILLARPRGVSEGDVIRFFPILQTILDRGDAASYGPHIVRDRFDMAAVPPSVLVGVVLDDNTVPNVSNYTLVRALDVPLIPPVLRPEPGVVTGPAAPVMGNVGGGMATAGLLQFDVIRDDDGSIDMAGHSNVGDSEVGATAWFEFLTSHWNDGLAVIVDPYALTMLDHMP